MGFLIDSLVIRTSLDTFPYGFAFAGDTMIFDILVFRLVDELTVETFSQGHSFGRYNCWIDAPSADVYLSIADGRTVIDSVGLSPMDNWFRKEIQKIRSTPYLPLVKEAFQSAILDAQGTLMSAKFIEGFYDLPNLTQSDIFWMQTAFNMELQQIKRHPWFTPLLARQKIMRSKLPKRLKKYPLEDQSGKVVKVQAPKNQLYVLDFYDARTTASRRDHEALKKVMQTDSIFTGVPVISITSGDYVDGWRNYVREGDFPWSHYMERSQTTRPGLVNTLAFFPNSTYLLVNEYNQIEGMFSSLERLKSAVRLRKQAELMSAGKLRN